MKIKYEEIQAKRLKKNNVFAIMPVGVVSQSFQWRTVTEITFIQERTHPPEVAIAWRDGYPSIPNPVILFENARVARRLK